MRETHLLVLQKKEKLFLALSLAAVVLCTVLAFGDRKSTRLNSSHAT